MRGREKERGERETERNREKHIERQRETDKEGLPAPHRGRRFREKRRAIQRLSDERVREPELHVFSRLSSFSSLFSLSPLSLSLYLQSVGSSFEN